jgi:hypothetical protein
MLESAKPTSYSSPWLTVLSARFVRLFATPFDLKHVQDVYNLFMVPEITLGQF